MELDPEAVYIDNGICDHPGEYLWPPCASPSSYTSVGYGDICGQCVGDDCADHSHDVFCPRRGLVIGTFSGIFPMNPSETAFRNVVDDRTVAKARLPARHAAQGASTFTSHAICSWQKATRRCLR